MASIFNWPDARSDLDLFGEQVQQRLALWNQARLQPRLPDEDWQHSLNRDHAMLQLEGSFLDALRTQVSAAAAVAAVPTEPEAFIAWYERLEEQGPGQHDPLFDWLATHADLEQMRWYLTQEAASEAGFDDLTA